jgi:hypothetical protein
LGASEDCPAQITVFYSQQKPLICRKGADGNNTRRLEGVALHTDVVAKEDDGASGR